MDLRFECLLNESVSGVLWCAADAVSHAPINHATVDSMADVLAALILSRAAPEIKAGLAVIEACFGPAHAASFAQEKAACVATLSRIMSRPLAKGNYEVTLALLRCLHTVLKSNPKQAVTISQGALLEALTHWQNIPQVVEPLLRITFMLWAPLSPHTLTPDCTTVFLYLIHRYSSPDAVHPAILKHLFNLMLAWTKDIPGALITAGSPLWVLVQGCIQPAARGLDVFFELAATECFLLHKAIETGAPVADGIWEGLNGDARPLFTVVTRDATVTKNVAVGRIMLGIVSAVWNRLPGPPAIKCAVRIADAHYRDLAITTKTVQLLQAFRELGDQPATLTAMKGILPWLMHFTDETARPATHDTVLPLYMTLMNDLAGVMPEEFRDHMSGFFPGILQTNMTRDVLATCLSLCQKLAGCRATGELLGPFLHPLVKKVAALGRLSQRDVMGCLAQVAAWGPPGQWAHPLLSDHDCTAYLFRAGPLGVEPLAADFLLAVIPSLADVAQANAPSINAVFHFVAEMRDKRPQLTDVMLASRVLVYCTAAFVGQVVATGAVDAVVCVLDAVARAMTMSVWAHSPASDVALGQALKAAMDEHALDDRVVVSVLHVLRLMACQWATSASCNPQTIMTCMGRPDEGDGLWAHVRHTVQRAPENRTIVKPAIDFLWAVSKKFHTERAVLLTTGAVVVNAALSHMASSLDTAFAVVGCVTELWPADTMDRTLMDAVYLRGGLGAHAENPRLASAAVFLLKKHCNTPAGIEPYMAAVFGILDHHPLDSGLVNAIVALCLVIPATLVLQGVPALLRAYCRASILTTASLLRVVEHLNDNPEVGLVDVTGALSDILFTEAHLFDNETNVLMLQRRLKTLLSLIHDRTETAEEDSKELMGMVDAGLRFRRRKQWICAAVSFAHAFALRH